MRRISRAIASNRLSPIAYRLSHAVDYVQQVLHEANQQTQILKQVDQITQLYEQIEQRYTQIEPVNTDVSGGDHQLRFLVSGD